MRLEKIKMEMCGSKLFLGRLPKPSANTIYGVIHVQVINVR